MAIPAAETTPLAVATARTVAAKSPVVMERAAQMVMMALLVSVADL